MNMLHLFQGIGSLAENFQAEPHIAIGRVVLIALGILLVVLGFKETLEPLIMVPMGFGMVAINAGMMIRDTTATLTANTAGVTQDITNIIISPMESSTDGLMNIMQIDFLQPIYSMTFANGLIACLVFMGIGVITDISPVLKYPFTTMLIALFAELGTILTFPIAIGVFHLDPGAAASVAVIGGADGPMVLFTALMLDKQDFVPITIIAYLYLSICYGFYPMLLKALVPKDLRGQAIKSVKSQNAQISPKAKIIFDIVACAVLCLLFPVAAPLFLSLFLGNAIKEAAVEKYRQLLENVFLYTATFFLGLLLGVLCDVNTLLNPRVLNLLILGFIALFLAAIGGILGGYIVWKINHKNFNVAIGIAGVSCVPTTAKIAQHAVSEVDKKVFVLQYAMGANVCGVITTAIFTGLYVTMILPYVQ